MLSRRTARQRRRRSTAIRWQRVMVEGRVRLTARVRNEDLVLECCPYHPPFLRGRQGRGRMVGCIRFCSGPSYLDTLLDTLTGLCLPTALSVVVEDVQGYRLTMVNTGSSRFLSVETIFSQFGVLWDLPWMEHCAKQLVQSWAS